MNLAQFQDQLTQLLFDPKTSLAARDIPELEPTPTLDKQVELYRRQALDNLAAQMCRVFPICHRLLPPREFRSACDQYFLSSVPQAMDPMQYAKGFIAFLEGFTTEKDLPYLADVAMMDYGCYQARQAMDAVPVNSKMFTDASPEQLSNRRIQLHPACFWMSSSYAIYDIWQRFNTARPTQTVNSLKSQEVLIIRPQLRVEVHKVDIGFVKTLDALDAGETLNQALLQGNLADPQFNAMAALQFLIQNKLIIALY